MEAATLQLVKRTETIIRYGSWQDKRCKWQTMASGKQGDNFSIVIVIVRDKIELYGCFQKAKLSLFSIKSITGNKQNGSKLSH